ncbi:CABIN1 [Lepeophtheirus salmonis]|uniref:CABIN1 n=1 Tax=Lepeophtheirus salmonis TaxID=72036 RepID=A0A7R8D5F1_LEPSM|nr:CABIN1 [Lepeophtheirus salmonis]CAF3035133.1 CABIN1 [Lepeophtheirus salmonis]
MESSYSFSLMMDLVRRPYPKRLLSKHCFVFFSHPSKKSRVKHLTDHGVSQIALTFDKSLLVFSNYLRPSTIPEFDDFKSNSISNDTEHFFKRMVALMPSDESGLNREETMMQSITSGKKVSLSKKGIPFNTELKDFYYLLADFYFKNSEFKPAISYYLLDLSYNEKRIDSWICFVISSCQSSGRGN